MKPESFFDEMFWRNAWNEANALNKGKNKQNNNVEAWNRRAKAFDSNTSSSSGNKRVNEVLAFLDSYCDLRGNMRILDLGCGPGSFSLAFAARGNEVVALDPSVTMLSLVEEKLFAQPELKPLVKTVAADWTVLDLDEFKWRGYFDLVFASMTPGIQDVDTLEKAMAASRRYVYLSRFAGPRIQNSVETIWQHIKGQPYFSPSIDIFYPQNWLYAAGYRPVIHYTKWGRLHKQPVGEAVAEIKDMLAMRMDLDKITEEYILEYIKKHADKNGMFSEYKGATSAMLLWDIEKEVLPLVKSKAFL